MPLENLKIYIAGHTGLVGSALVRRFSTRNSIQLILAKRSELDLTNQEAVSAFLMRKKPDVVIVAAGKVGGIHTNSLYPADFIYENLMIEANVIHAAWKAGVKRLLNFGSACIYPKVCLQPMAPDLLMTGKLEETNEPYTIAKFAGMSLCSSYNQQYGTDYINAIPSNVYGPCETFDLERCHVIAALIHRFHEAKTKGVNQISLWGSGRVKRDFLFVDDLAEACEVLLERYHGSTPINVGAQAPCTIADLTILLKGVVGFEGTICWDTSKPDGAPERVLEASLIKDLDWAPRIGLKEGLQKTYQWFLERGEKCASL